MLRRTLFWLIVLFGIGLILVLISNPSSRPIRSRLVLPEEQDLRFSVADQADLGFTRAKIGTPVIYPNDFGPHYDYQTEWWYYTGNLTADTGQHFGFQLTIFRRALSPPRADYRRDSNWASSQVYMAHFAITDVAGDEHLFYDKFARGAAGLAGVEADPFQAWVGDWVINEIEKEAIGSLTVDLSDDLKDQAKYIYQLRAEQDQIRIDVLLLDIKGPILHGINGYSQKGPGDGNASIYISQTRLVTIGTIEVGDKVYSVKGNSWMDHEYSTSALGQDQIGWDWFSIQFDNGNEVMVFQIRNEDGSVDPFSSGTWITRAGDTINLSREDFEIKVLEDWISPHTSGRYPAKWEINIPKLGVSMVVTSSVQDQEVNLAYSYWEGSVTVNGEQRGSLLMGRGYVELTGYARSFAGEF